MSYSIEYFIESETMTDEEYESQDFKEITLTQEEFDDIVYDWVQQNAKYDYEGGESICRDNFYINIKR